jgi:hypothetical protein
MKPLLYLATRSTINGFVRALKTPRRLIGLILIVGYYFLIFSRFAFGGLDRARPLPADPQFRIQFPPLDMVDAVLFLLFAGFSLILALGIVSFQSNFKAADVDVLFPTPVSPKLVLTFRLLRDTFVTLLAPLILVILMYRPTAMGWQALFENVPDQNASAMALRLLPIASLLVALSWVSLSHAASLFVNRSDRQSDWNKRILIALLITVFLVVGLYAATRVQNLRHFTDIIEISQSPVLRTVFFTATAATTIVMSALAGNLVHAGLGVAFLLSVIVAGVAAAMSQVRWMYDQAAVRGFETIESREMVRSGDLMGAMAAQARRKPAKAQRVGFLHQLKLNGPLALLWKDAFLQLRGMKGMMILIGLMILFMNILPIIGAPPRMQITRADAIFFLLMQAFAVFIGVASVGQTGFVELLRRVDLQKPLPFTPGTVAFIEMAAKGVYGAAVAAFAALVVLVLEPRLWPYVIASWITTPFMALLLSGVTLTVLMIFPDVEDASQRPFRGMITMIAIGVLVAPGLIAFGVTLALGIQPIIAAVVTAVLNLGMAIGLALLAGSLYSSYNPSD